jgi:putative membrane-bound dehydrogenase-like protein
MISQGGEYPNNGAWFRADHLWVQNERTSRLADLVERRSFAELLTGDESQPKSPVESLACLKVRPGFDVELVASEPLVVDPVAFEWGADGKLWVAEMRDYPWGIDNQGKRGGVVKYLEDTDGDGRYDKATVFVDNLNFPNGVMPWRGGVLISAAPEILYAEDTDGNGKADVVRPILRGFVEGNQQHRVNGFEYGLDNWVYAANGDSGGGIISVGKVLNVEARAAKANPADRAVSLRGHDLRFRPDEGTFETVAGQTQFGRRRDDWGNWFGNNNPNWVWHYFLPEHYLKRNASLAVNTTRQLLANYPNSNRAHPISHPQRRFNWPDAANAVTSANSATPYRDELFGPDFNTSVFTSEPAQNLVHREVLIADGVTFASRRDAEEQDREFLSSTDNWFRPTMLKTGPDGALYIADMYRLIIEHPEYFPDELKNRPDLRAGDDKGRIYRVFPSGAKLKKVRRLDNLDAAALASRLESSNGWERDTAQRLLVHRPLASAVRPLTSIALSGSRPKSRLQALCALDGMRALTPSLLLQALRDQDPGVREHVVRLSEQFLTANKPAGGMTQTQRSSSSDREKWAVALLSLVDDPSPRVRYQLAFTLGEWPDTRAGEGLARLARANPADLHLRTAILSSAKPQLGDLLRALTDAESALLSPDFQAELMGLAAEEHGLPNLGQALRFVTRSDTSEHSTPQLEATAGFLEALDRRGIRLDALRTHARPDARQGLNELGRIFERARRLAADSASTVADRLIALRLLGRGADATTDLKLLASLLHPHLPLELQHAALASLKRIDSPMVADLLLSQWQSLLPSLRTEVLNTLLGRSGWVSQLLNSLERKEFTPSEIGPIHSQKLLQHTDGTIREKAAKLFSTPDTDRAQVLKDYSSVPALVGDAQRGAAIYRQSCMVCHRLKGEGTELGPDLGTMSDKPVTSLLTAILDPNQAVEARYLNYTAVTGAGREVSGVVTAETPNSITLKSAGGTEETILRSDLKALTSSRLSIMPEGFENSLSPQALGDLIAYILSE